MAEYTSRRDILRRTAQAVLVGALAYSGLEVLSDETKTPCEKMNKYKTTDQNFSKESDEVLIARMLFGEARNCSDLEKVAIAYTPINRANDKKSWNGKTIREAILKKERVTRVVRTKKGRKKLVKFTFHQYSCFSARDKNLTVLMNPEKYNQEEFYRCLDIARKVLSGEYSDPLGATHYFNPSTLGTKKAEELRKSWRATMTEFGKIELGKNPDGMPLFSKHEFYREN